MSDPLNSSQVTIPARVCEDGKLAFFYGGSMPRLTSGSIVDVVVPEYAVESDFHLRLLKEIQPKMMFPEVTMLAVQIGDAVPLHSHVSQHDVHLSHEFGLIKSRENVTGVIVWLMEPLFIDVSVGKPARLRPCTCQIPALNGSAGSLNEAYSLISQEYEPKRRSHTGNVFDKVFFIASGVTNGRQVLHPLRDRRYELVAELEAEIANEALPWWYCGNGRSYSGMWAYLNAPGDLWANVQLIKPLATSLLEAVSLVVGNLDFESRMAAVDWLRFENFTHAGTNDELRRLQPPNPPYVTRRGQPVTL